MSGVWQAGAVTGTTSHIGVASASAVVGGRADGGAVVRVEVAGPDAEAVAGGIRGGVRPEWWPAFGLEPVAHSPNPDPDPDLVLRVDLTQASSVDRAESDLGLFAVEHLDAWVAVHAALVRVDGRVVMLPGPSHAGKSTLCGAVLEAGGEVLSDEYALVSPDAARVAGWPRRVRLRDSVHSFRRVGSPIGGEVTRVDLIAVVRHDSGADAPLAVSELPAAEAVTAVLANTVCAASRPRFAFDAAVALCRVVPAVSGVRGEAGAALAALVTLARQLTPPNARAVGPTDGPAPPEPAL